MLKFLHTFVLDENGEPKLDKYGERIAFAEPRPKLREELSDAEKYFHDAGLGHEAEQQHSVRVARWAVERDALLRAAQRIAVDGAP